MDHDLIEREQTVQRYLLGRLSPAETEAFEEHYLDCPECLAELRAAETLHRGLRAAAARHTAESAATSSVLRLGLLATLARRLRRPGLWTVLGWVIAAALGAALTTTLLLDRTEPTGETVIAYLSPVRSGNAAGAVDSGGPRLHPPPAGGWVVLALDLAAEPGALHRISLHRHDRTEPLWISDPLTTGRDGELTVSLPAELLLPGRHRVEVEPLPPGDPSPTPPVFPFEVLPSPAS